MAVLRKRRRRASVGLGALVFALVPNTIGFQDLGALLARQPGVAARAYAQVIASPFGTIHAATFSMPSPIGTAIPHPPVYALANFDPGDIAASIASQFLGDPNAPLQFPKVNRKDKHDSFIARSRAPLPPLPPVLAVEPMPLAQADAPLKDEEASRFDPYADYQFAAAPDEQLPPPDAQVSPPDRKDASRVYFGANPLAPGEEQIAPWASGQAPVVMAVGRSRHQAIGAGAGAAGRRQSRREHRRQGRSHRRSSSGRNRRPSGSGLPGRRAPRPRSVSPTRSISNRATNRCAPRSRWRRW